jgi:hypothetical protein
MSRVYSQLLLMTATVRIATKCDTSDEPAHAHSLMLRAPLLRYIYLNAALSGTLPTAIGQCTALNEL